MSEERRSDIPGGFASAIVAGNEQLRRDEERMHGLRNRALEGDGTRDAHDHEWSVVIGYGAERLPDTWWEWSASPGSEVIIGYG